jgi:hypothetical protein
MRPPECGLCGHTDSGTQIVRFASDPAAQAWRARARVEGFVGHPPDEEWFCSEHLAAAEALCHQTRDTALASLRAQVRGSPGTGA